MSYSELPGEVIANIVDKVLHDHAQRRGTAAKGSGNICKEPIQTIRDVQKLRSLNKATNQAVNHHLQRHFHAFEPTFEPIVRAHNTRWIPNINTRRADELAYWTYHIGCPPPTAGNIRAQVANLDRANSIEPLSVKIDARVKTYTMAYDFDGQPQVEFHKWIASGMLLCRIARPNPRLKSLHIRMSMCNDFALIVEQILRQSPNLTDVVIEADMPTPWDFANRATLTLDNLFSADKHYAEMERFIIRAPGLHINAKNSHKFFRRIRTCTVFCFAVHSLDVPNKTAVWQWTQRLLTDMPRVERAEISVSDDRFPGTSNNGIQDDIGVCILPHLTHLTLDLQEVSANLLRNLEAPALQHLRIRSVLDVARRGACKDGHFPSLLTATINCHGSYMDGFVALGKSMDEVKRGIELTPQVEFRRYSRNEGWCRFGSARQQRDYLE
ncbi:hypothetical protein OC835_005874 [Tilletia horrida]|nr:hypothetical protein OC835_005874 [Tilletia horrida]